MTWSYRATVTDVVDGDTIGVDLDLGFNLHMGVRVRLAGCNARELEAPGGQAARRALRRLVKPGDQVQVVSTGWDRYAERIDGRVLTPAGGPDLSVQMIAAGWAAPWNGRGRRPVPPWPRVKPT
jgi:micrococcal nuclease